MTTYSSLTADIFDRKVSRNLTVEEERDLIAAAQSGDDEATFTLMYAYAAVLNNSVKWFTRAMPSTPRASELEDIRSQAIMGFMEAVQAFKLDNHNRLAAIVREYVNNAVSVAAASVSGFAIPERTLKRFFSILRKADGNEYEAARLAPEFSMSRETFFTVLSAVRNVESYDGMTGHGEDEDGSSGDFYAHEIGVYARTEEEIVEDKILVEAAFEAVDDLEADVTRLYYGFADYNTVSDAEIAHRLGLSRPKTQRVRSSSLGKMRNALGVA